MRRCCLQVCWCCGWCCGTGAAFGSRKCNGEYGVCRERYLLSNDARNVHHKHRGVPDIVHHPDKTSSRRKRAKEKGAETLSIGRGERPRCYKRSHPQPGVSRRSPLPVVEVIGPLAAAVQAYSHPNFLSRRCRRPHVGTSITFFTSLHGPLVCLFDLLCLLRASTHNNARTAYPHPRRIGDMREPIQEPRGVIKIRDVGDP